MDDVTLANGNCNISQKYSVIGLYSSLVPYPRQRLETSVKAQVRLLAELTINTSIVGFNPGLLDLAIFNEQRISFRTRLAENGCCVECKIESVREAGVRVAQEADLLLVNLWDV